MSGGILVGLAIACCVAGFVLNSRYSNKYGEAAVQWRPFVLQFVFLCGVLSQLPGDGISCWFLFWAIGVVISCAAGLWMCRQHAKRQQAGADDTVAAMAAQVILPIGIAIVVLLVAGMIAFGFLWDH
ncbi:MAG TPA: hypothetical protein DEG55_04945 [Acidaminococcaceae bacterium]|nr:hypothetical protein [Acidaminococcaceae bacterium]